MKNNLESPFRLTLEHYGEKITVEKPNSDLTSTEVVEMFKSLMLAAGFSESCVNKEPGSDFDIDKWNELMKECNGISSRLAFK